MKNRLLNHYRTAGKLDELNAVQLNTFEHACQKAVIENPELGFSDLIIACNVYLYYIQNFPDLSLGAPQPPDPHE